MTSKFIRSLLGQDEGGEHKLLSLLDIVEQHLIENEWRFERDNSKSLIHCGIQGENASFRLLLLTKEEKRKIIVFAVSPTQVPEAHRVGACEFLTRANYGLTMGNFEMDLKDGEVRFRMALDAEECAITPNMIKPMIGMAVVTMDRYYPGLMAMMFAGKSPAEAIAQVEGGE